MPNLRVKPEGIEETKNQIKEVDDLSDKVNRKVDQKTREAKQEIEGLEVNSGKVIRKVGEGIQQSWSVLQQYLSIAGISIGGVLGSVIRSVFAGLASLQALATAQLSNAFTAFMAVSTFMAVNIASVQAVKAQIEAEREQQNLARIEEFMQDGWTVRL